MTNAMWIWGAIGLILLAIEMATGTFYIVWFGISALCLALIMGLAPNLSFNAQLAFFAILSIGSLGIWKSYYRKNDIPNRVGQSQGEEIGMAGTITEACSPTQNGKIIFLQGVMGSREWSAVSSETIAVGQKAKIVAVEGNSVRVSANID
jgi:inner membrane protein